MAKRVSILNNNINNIISFLNIFDNLKKIRIPNSSPLVEHLHSNALNTFIREFCIRKHITKFDNPKLLCIITTFKDYNIYNPR